MSIICHRIHTKMMLGWEWGWGALLLLWPSPGSDAINHLHDDVMLIIPLQCLNFKSFWYLNDAIVQMAHCFLHLSWTYLPFYFKIFKFSQILRTKLSKTQIIVSIHLNFAPGSRTFWLDNFVVLILVMRYSLKTKNAQIYWIILHNLCHYCAMI